MPSRELWPSVEVGPFYCLYEDDRWSEPQIIVDPLSGFVVAIVPPPERPPRARPRRPGRRTRPLWRDTLRRWLQLGGVAAALPVPARRHGQARSPSGFS